MPGTTGQETLQEFAVVWTCSPFFTPRQGWRRTWVVRAASPPSQRVAEHQSGFAVIKEHEPRQRSATQIRERWQQPRASNMLAFPPLKPPESKAKLLQTNQCHARTNAVPPTEVARPPLLAEPSLEERIARAVAAAMAPISAQIAALQSNPVAVEVPAPDAPMTVEAVTETLCLEPA